MNLTGLDIWAVLKNPDLLVDVLMEISPLRTEFLVALKRVVEGAIKRSIGGCVFRFRSFKSHRSALALNGSSISTASR
jgi:hypothetical protein